MPTEKSPFAPAKKAKAEKAAPELVNIHPADELAALREEIKILENRADVLKDKLKEDGADLHGDTYDAVILTKTRETLDRKALTEAFGEAAVAPFVKTTSYKQVDLKEHD